MIFHAFPMNGMIHRLLQGDAHGALVRLGRLPGLATALGPVVRQHLGTRGRGSTSHEKSWEKWGFHGVSWGLMGFNGISWEIHWDLNGFKKYTKQNLDLRCMGLSENDWKWGIPPAIAISWGLSPGEWWLTNGFRGMIWPSNWVVPWGTIFSDSSGWVAVIMNE